MVSLIRSEKSEVKWDSFAAKSLVLNVLAAEDSFQIQIADAKRCDMRQLGVAFFIDRRRELLVAHYISFYWHHSEAKLQPAGKLGPNAAFTTMLLVRYAIAVCRLTAL